MNRKQSIKREGIIAGLAIVLLVLSAVPARAQLAGEQSYCSVPPFLASSSAQPNVMIMLDNSGSMADHPFTSTYNPTQFISGYYFGYFDPTKMYKYDKTNKWWSPYSADPIGYDDKTQPIASGNLLNWAVTRKMEVAKKLLVGGNPGIISGVPNSRTVTSPNTVKLYTEDAGSSNNVTFDNSTALPANYLVPGYTNVIYPFNGSFTYKLGSGGCSSGPPCSKLSLTPTNSGTTTETLYPNNDISVASNWIRMNNLTTSSTGSYYTYVDETSQNSDATTIANRVDTQPVIFNYGPSSGVLSGQIIQDVNLVVTARMVDGTSGACVLNYSSGCYLTTGADDSGCYLTNVSATDGCYTVTPSAPTDGCYYNGNTCSGGSCSSSGSGNNTYCKNTICQVKKNTGVCSAVGSGTCSFQNFGGTQKCAPVVTTTCNGSDTGGSCSMHSNGTVCRSDCQISGTNFATCSGYTSGVTCSWQNFGGTQKCAPIPTATCNGSDSSGNCSMSSNKCISTYCQVSGASCSDYNNSGKNCSWQNIGGTQECVPQNISICNGVGCAMSSNICSSSQCKITNNGATCSNNSTGANCGWQTVNGISQCVPGGSLPPTITTRAIQGVLSIGTGGTTTTIASTFTNLNNTSTTYNKYATYTFTWANNPVTGQPWSFDDIKNGTSTTTLLNGFGVQNFGSSVYSGATVSCYVNITQEYLYVDATQPTGGPYSLVVDTGQQSITGMLDSLASGARFGLGTYGRSSNGAQVLVPVDFDNMNVSKTPNMVTNVILMDANGNTPLAESEYELLNYFRQVSPMFDTTTYAYNPGNKTVRDPYYFMYSHMASHGTSTHDDQYVPCAKSYILLMTDGEPTADDMQKYDGFTNVSLPTGFTTNRFNTTSYLDDLTLWGRTTDMRPGTCSGAQSTWTFPCIPSPPAQNVVTYPIFLFGTGSNLLQSAAINGGFSGLPSSSGLPPCLNPANPTQLKPGVTQVELKTCFRFASDNTSGVLNPVAPWGTGDDPPLTYYEGADAYALQASLTTAIADMMKRSASGTAVSVLTTSSRGVGSMLQAYFLPIRQEGLRQVMWTGYAQNIWLYDDLREDTVPDKQLIMSQDEVLKMYLDPTNNETRAGLFTTDDQGLGGSLASCASTTTVPFSDISYLWEAGQKLALTRPSARTIFTAKNVIRGGSTTNTFTSSDFTVSGLTTNPTFSTALNADSVYSAENIVRYVRGECLESNDGSGNPINGDTSCTSTANTTFRDRRVTVLDNKTNANLGDANGNVWKLGDIITSTPQVLGTKPVNAYFEYYGDKTYNDFTQGSAYSTRSSIAIVGANDGLLHAFRVGYLKPQDATMLANKVWALFKNFYTDLFDGTHDRLGEEVWAYVPFNAFPYLKYLADPNYCHIYYNDLPVTLVDASLGGTSNPNPTDTKTSGSWKTIAIGSMRFGGCGGEAPLNPPAGSSATVGFSAYYAIDITDSEHPVPLWEFTDPDLGYATSFPAITRTGDTSTDKMSRNGYWYVSFGSGSKVLPSSTSDIGRSSSGYVYILDLKTGALVKKIQLDHNAIVGDVLAVDANKDYLSEKLYFGTAYNSSGWKGKLVSIDIPNQNLSASWTPQVNYLFTGNTPFTAKPDATLDSNYKTWVFAGSGKYYSATDQQDNSQQVFLGFKDFGITSAITVAGLDNRTNTTTTGAVKSTTQVCMYDPTTNPTTSLPYGFGFQTVVTAITSTVTTAPSTTGWYINLATTPAGERVISRPTVFGGLVDFLTYVPNGDPCNAGGDSYLYSVGYTTGTAPSTVSIYNASATNNQTSGNVTVQKGIKMGVGTPPTGESIILTPKISNENILSKKVQVSTGVIVELTDNPPMDTTSRILHWLRK